MLSLSVPPLLRGNERQPLAPPDGCPVGLLSHLEILRQVLVGRMHVLSAPSGDVRSSPRSEGQRSGLPSHAESLLGVCPP